MFFGAEEHFNSTTVNLCAPLSASLSESEPIPCSALADTLQSYASEAGPNSAFTWHRPGRSINRPESFGLERRTR